MLPHILIANDLQTSIIKVGEKIACSQPNGQEITMEYIHYNVPGMPSGIYYGTVGISFRMVSHPRKTDSDGDGLKDSVDAQPLVKFDDRFMLVNSNDFVDTHYDYGQSCFNTISGNYFKRTFLLMKYTAIVTLGYTPALTLYQQEHIKGEYTLGNTSQFSKFLFSYLNYMYDLNRFEDNTIYLSTSDMSSIINTQKNNKQHHSYNINQMRQAIESMLKAGASNTLYISTTSDNNFKATCFKGNFCSAHHVVLYDNNTALDWAFAIGEAMCGMVAEARYVNGQYTMKLKYYLLDTYEFPVHWDEDNAEGTVNQETHYLHECGEAREYKIVGVLEENFVWDKGELLCSDYYNSSISIDTDAYNKGPIS